MKAIVKNVMAVALAATLGYGATANASTVDLFDDPFLNGVNTVTDSNPTAGSFAFQEYGYASSILGGYRDLVADLVGSNGFGVPSATAEVGGGGYSFSTTSGDKGIGRIQWDGQDNSANLAAEGLKVAGVGANLIHQVGCPDGGCNTFVATVLEADLGFQYSIGVYSDAANYVVLTSNTLFPIGSAYLSTYDFAWFALPTGDYFLGGLPFHIDKFGTGADFTNVGAIEFVVNSDGATTAVDLALDSIRKVPEPGTLALLGIGLLGATLAGRRRKAGK